MSILKRIGDIKIELGQEQMGAFDWFISLCYIGVAIAFLYFHTEVAIWVYLFVYFREWALERTDKKCMGKPLSKRNG